MAAIDAIKRAVKRFLSPRDAKLEEIAAVRTEIEAADRPLQEAIRAAERDVEVQEEPRRRLARLREEAASLSMLPTTESAGLSWSSRVP
jgi:hypothetical protein